MKKFRTTDEQAIKHWVLPEVTGQIVGFTSDEIKPQTVEDIEALQKQAYEEARAQGYEAGRQEGLADMQKQAQQLMGMLDFLEHPLQEMDEHVEQQLTELAFTIGRLLLNRECGTDASHIQGVIHQALDFLPIKSRDIRVRLNPQDIQLLQSAGIDTAAEDWQCIEDAGVTQGGCFVESDQSHIDASVETRIQQVMEQLTSHRSKTDDDEA